ncbi:MAG: ferrochelatase [Gemmatimonadota bacterium]|nr:MAG: ferrochelatase [Gemmatimonadota bacterium]
MKTGVMVLNFGEPEEANEETVEPFLERIFMANAGLGGPSSAKEATARSQKMARARAPGLIEEYREIGGSPVNEQARQQARQLQRELKKRGLDATCYVGMQFVEPFIRDAVAKAKKGGMERLVGLPIYPLCGKSTTMAALDDLQAAVDDLDWAPQVREITGWHRHPEYRRLHAEHISAYATRQGIALHDAGTKLLFSAHGTPLKYLDDGPRYLLYVEETCRMIARALGVADYLIGYQNHSNRPIDWTQPDIETVIKEVEAKRVVVVAVSFMHEQSETLSELDIELRKEADQAGLEFYRVPIPHDNPRFTGLLADLVMNALRDEPVMGPLGMKRCLCRGRPNTFCLNASS